ncbi:uncharacterized protein [Aegilops tauschii subsp. strangulata]|uniref:uncharacterized protein isoform X1 n=1 Tax=Aegilops tauschii subsp. strangulata TaxID=200361 RepID=UPI001E1CA546|nr:uncharacterized protein LOC123494751 isoform X1 [Aegilops tauschii subsp. strangulata]XP_045086982.1 uncharacterized protein LOC123494751 isoform X1 [Aegilops tauschii subsp. strangulata]
MTSGMSLWKAGRIRKRWGYLKLTKITVIKSSFTKLLVHAATLCNVIFWEKNTRIKNSLHWIYSRSATIAAKRKATPMLCKLQLLKWKTRPLNLQKMANNQTLQPRLLLKCLLSTLRSQCFLSMWGSNTCMRDPVVAKVKQKWPRRGKVLSFGCLFKP